MAKRLGIFHMYDPDGIADDYIIHMLKAINEQVSRLVVVYNGEMQPDSIDRLKMFADSVFSRDNIGFDCGAFKDALTDFVGWDEVYRYDELVLVNDSCYGPLFPLGTVFDEMSVRECDFWAITRNGDLYLDSEYCPSHLQSYFMVIRSDLLRSSDFRQFWQELEYPEDYMSAVLQYEARFTVYFESLKYKASSYVDSEAYIDTPEKNFPYVYYDSYRLLADHGCPLVQRKVFTFPNAYMLEYNAAETARKTLDYISTMTEYPVQLIWKHLIRLCDINDLRAALHLNYVFPSEARITSGISNRKRTVVIAHIFYNDLIETCFKYINKVPADIDVIITTSIEGNRRRIEELFYESGRENYRIVVSKNRGREISALLVACSDFLMEYEYLCFVHDKKSSHAPYMTVGSSFMDLLWENSIKSGEYIENVLDCFERNPLLGFLSPPKPYLTHYLSLLLGSWLVNFEEVSRLASCLELNCKMSANKQPFALGTTFWCRTAALKTLFEHDFKYEDFHEEPMPVDFTISHAIERIFLYVAQHEGYYSGVMMTDEYASLYAVNLEYMVDTIIPKPYGKLDRLRIYDIIDFNIEALVDFCKKYKNIYVYGAGVYAAKCTHTLGEEISQFMGYIVSDGRKAEKTWTKDKIFELSEITPHDDEGIIVALNKENRQMVLPELEKRGFKNFVTFLRK